MNDPRRLWVWVGVGVIVVIVVVWFFWRPSSPQRKVPVPVFAPTGQLVPEFPKQLILDDNAAITGSYSLAYASSTNQYTANFDSSSTVTSLYDSYKTYFQKNNWDITGSLDTHPNFDAIAATQGLDNVQVVISTPPKGKGSEVTVTYVGQ